MPEARRGTLVWRSVAPAKTMDISLWFNFEGGELEVLGRAFDLFVNYQVGGGPNQTLVVHFERE